MSDLTQTELREFTSLVKEAHTHRASAFRFVEILTEIKERKLHRATGEKFDEFVRREFQIDAKRAYSLIAAGEVSKRMSQISDIVPNEAQAKAIAKAPVEQQAEVWQEVCEETDRPTAAKVKEVVDRRREEMDAAKSFHQRGGDEADESDDEPEPSYSDRFMDAYNEHCQPIFDEADEVGKQAIRLRLMQRFET